MSIKEVINLTVCGDGNTGKSSLTTRLVRSRWHDDYDPTIEDFYSVERILDGKRIKVNLTDTAGQEEYRGLFGTSSLAGADGFLLVYDITTPGTLPALKHFLNLIQMETEHRHERGLAPPVKVIVGNKCDLKQLRAICSKEGMDFARTHDCMFMETSALHMVNVEETFAVLVRKVLESRRMAREGFAAHQTQPLYPAKESTMSYGSSYTSSSSFEVGKGRGGFWRRLICM